MKIWKAELILFYNKDEKHEIKFVFESQEKDYKINEHTNDEWVYFKNWVNDRIPMIMTIERYYDNYKVIQGFDHELSKNELLQLENDMKNLMRKQLNYDKKLYLKRYEDKLKAI